MLLLFYKVAILLQVFVAFKSLQVLRGGKKYSSLFSPHHERNECLIQCSSSPTAVARSDGNEAQLETKLHIGLSQLKPFLSIAVPFFKEDTQARNSLLGVGGMTLLNTGVSVAFSYISRDFYNALNARDEALFYEKIEYFFLALVVAVPVSVYYRFLREKLSLYWREALTSRALDLYFKDKKFYELETIRDIDNPDQRIADDIRYFTRTSLDFFISIITSIIDLCSFSAILFQIYPALFGAIIAYAGIGSFVTTKIGGSLVSLNYDRLIKEANFRFSIIRTRENSESIAFYDSNAKSEKVNLWSLFRQVADNQIDIINVRRNIEAFTTAYRYLVQILPSLIVAPLYFQNKIELGSISQSYGAFNHVLGDFSIIINQFESISAFSAGITRLQFFFDRLKSGPVISTQPTQVSLTELSDDPLFRLSNITVNYQLESYESSNTSLTAQSDLLLRIRNLTVLTPDRSRVVIGAINIDSDLEKPPSQLEVQSQSQWRGIDFDVDRGAQILIVGPSGCGKSSFLRATAGLWSAGFGSITWFEKVDRNHTGRTTSTTLTSFFLPQKPYNVIGSLRDQIKYPSTVRCRNCSEDQISDDHSIHASESNIAKEAQLTRPGTTHAALTPEADNFNDTDEHLLQLLKLVKLETLAYRVGGGDTHAGLRLVCDWSKILSLGEQQRLAFARVLYNKASIVFLDEATSALDLESESAMYQVLKSTNATYLSVGHRPSLLKFHVQKLVLSGAGRDAQLVDIDPNGSQEVAVNNLL